MHYLIKDTAFEQMVKFLKEQKRIHKNNKYAHLKSKYIKRETASRKKALTEFFNLNIF